MNCQGRHLKLYFAVKWSQAQILSSFSLSVIIVKIGWFQQTTINHLKLKIFGRDLSLSTWNALRTLLLWRQLETISQSVKFIILNQYYSQQLNPFFINGIWKYEYWHLIPNSDLTELLIKGYLINFSIDHSRHTNVFWLRFVEGVNCFKTPLCVTNSKQIWSSSTLHPSCFYQQQPFCWFPAKRVVA